MEKTEILVQKTNPETIKFDENLAKEVPKCEDHIIIHLRNNNVPLLVAGGGGGLKNLNKRLENCDASNKTSGKNNKCVTPCVNWAEGVNRQGAKQADSENSGDGGGGFYSNGRSSNLFGGSGGTYGNRGGPGGGGGSSGGASGDNVNGACGGGGGSYNVGKNQVNKSAFNEKGDGYVFLTLYVN
ncbi:glycine-rich RNA-binding protein GRP2A-like [Xenia sp. Carnegie-2017]|uniref:glycine-rich RNA-binding protein GRP2A-like n=1 Tax=Xenia sp. Carnegie-2017 TaxID=2897299 RepID=UPI001F0436BB|nr:glycine-rich RNA-binding protein GRP2A-like [Xenia sp. Carnegie-2017]